MSKKQTETPSDEFPTIPERKSIIQPIIDDLNRRDDLKGTTSTEFPQEDEVAPPRGPLHPPQPAELDQDPGGGYNPDGTYPQT